MSKKSELVQRSSVSEDAADQSKSNETAFSFHELATTTKNFRQGSFIGKGSCGPVYKGIIESTGQIVAVKRLDQNGSQGDKEFLVEVHMLSLLRHPNLVNLVGYCDDGGLRILVYEFLPLGSLENRLHDLTPDMQPLDWITGMKVAAGTAKGLSYLHHQANPPVIYGELKSSNILMDEGLLPKLSDFGIAKFCPNEDRTHITTRLMSTYGYFAPEYAATGKPTMKSDVYSFGIVLLEIITRRRALDDNCEIGKHALINWARPFLNDCKNCVQLADPQLNGEFQESVFCIVVDVVLMCVRDDVPSRPTMIQVAAS